MVVLPHDNPILVGDVGQVLQAAKPTGCDTAALKGHDGGCGLETG